MKKFVIKIADLYIEINHRYDLVFKACKDYIVESDDIDIVAKCNDEDIGKHMENSIEYSESICLLESIASKLWPFNKVLIHGAAIEYDGLGYLFLAPSGTGKSTHISLWKDNIEGVSIINGDKPIIDKNGYVYGTPWCGKEGWNKNKSAKIGGIVILSRDSYNHIERSSLSDNLAFILSQIYKDDSFEHNINIVDQAFKDIPVYKLGCTKDVQAAEICFKAIIKA